jgi:hypothetical protein
MGCHTDGVLGQINTEKYVYTYADSTQGSEPTAELLGGSNSASDYPVVEDTGNPDHDSQLGGLSNTQADVYYGDAEWDCKDYLEAPVGCYDNWVNFGSCYAIDGYYDGLILAGDCTGCAESSATAWDGTFTSPYGCDSGNTEFYSLALTNGGTASIDGVLSFYTTNLIYYGGSSPYYWMYIDCSDGEDPATDYTVWQGKKYIGIDFTGVYDYEEGCDTTSTLTLVTC